MDLGRLRTKVVGGEQPLVEQIVGVVESGGGNAVSGLGARQIVGRLGEDCEVKLRLNVQVGPFLEAGQCRGADEDGQRLGVLAVEPELARVEVADGVIVGVDLQNTAARGESVVEPVHADVEGDEAAMNGGGVRIEPPRRLVGAHRLDEPAFALFRRGEGIKLERFEVVEFLPGGGTGGDVDG